jgi:hypothetical protein
MKKPEAQWKSVKGGATSERWGKLSRVELSVISQKHDKLLKELQAPTPDGLYFGLAVMENLTGEPVKTLYSSEEERNLTQEILEDLLRERADGTHLITSRFTRRHSTKQDLSEGPNQVSQWVPSMLYLGHYKWHSYRTQECVLNLATGTVVVRDLEHPFQSSQYKEWNRDVSLLLPEKNHAVMASYNSQVILDRADHERLNHVPVVPSEDERWHYLADLDKLIGFEMCLARVPVSEWLVRY